MARRVVDARLKTEALRSEDDGPFRFEQFGHQTNEGHAAALPGSREARQDLVRVRTGVRAISRRNLSTA